MSNHTKAASQRQSSQCNCPMPVLARRNFIQHLGLGAAALALQPLNLTMAGPFTRADFEKLVPADKKLSPEWIKSLTARGERTQYRGKELANIGMPVGGICAGQLYLGGDGKLWHWDIFNRKHSTSAEHYANPMKPASPLDQGFVVRTVANGKQQVRILDSTRWKDVSFIGEYPIGCVTYADPQCPLSISLEAFSPFVPLNVDDSSLPATILEFTIENKGADPIEGELAGWLENAVCLFSGQARDGIRRNRSVRKGGLLFLECAVEELPPAPPNERPDILFDGFERDTYGDWTATGTAFGSGPVAAANMPEYQGNVGAKGERLVNSHASAPGREIREKDDAIGQLTSRAFTIERDFITFLIGGGNHKGHTCLNLRVDGTAVLSATGAANNHLEPRSWDVRQWIGKTAQLVIVDDQKGDWGNIGVDDIVFSDRPRQPLGPLAHEEDFGTLGLALLDSRPSDLVQTCLPTDSTDSAPENVFTAASRTSKTSKKPFGQKLLGSLTRKFKLQPGQSTKATFVLAWHFPNLRLNRLPPGRFYGTRFNSAFGVARFVAHNFDRLASLTRRWHDTWYDSTLPFWFLDRTFLNTSILATSTCYRLGNGRFYAWEGVGCCEGTCGHVWHYAQAMARLFPELERGLREKVDLGLALQPDGAIHFRGEFNNIPAIDAQAGTVLRALREHQMSGDDAFLKRNWPNIKKATQWLIDKDGDGDGLIEGNQHNTLDADWYGPVAWLSGLYLAALLAAETLALELGDTGFASRCRKIFAIGQKNIVAKLFNNDYFINQVSPNHLDAINSGTGCEIDQVMGQSWAFQVGLPRVLPEKETLAALRSLWKHNFTPDVGPYREAYKAGRWFAMPGEAGLLMCTFPQAGWDYAQAKGNKGQDGFAGYFNECMNGFEYQAAGHMLWEGLITEGLAITRAVHDRYHASRRNPWNEVECGDHYARSMASYGVYLAACGYEYHGPKGHLGFAPRLSPENFRAAFTAAEGWGTYRQQRSANSQSHRIEVKHGQLQLRTLSVEIPPNARAGSVSAKLGGKSITTRVAQAGARVELIFEKSLVLNSTRILEVNFGFV